MIRNDLQHIQLDSQKSKQEPALHEQEASTAAFLLKALNSSLPILNKILKTSITLILVVAFLPIYEVPILLCMCVPWTIRQYAGFSTARK
jgi:methylmalonyl-CoA mutase